MNRRVGMVVALFACVGLAACGGAGDIRSRSICGPGDERFVASAQRLASAVLPRRTEARGFHEAPGALPDPPFLPDLSGLQIQGHATSTLVRHGLVLRTLVLVLATSRDGAEARSRAVGPSFASCVSGRLGVTRADPVTPPRGASVALRLTVPRLAEPGTDPVEILVAGGGRILGVVEAIGPVPPSALRAVVRGIAARSPGG